MSKLPLHRTRIASIQRLQHWLTRGQGFAADCPPPQCRACCKPGGKANDPAPLLPLCDANTPIFLVSEPPARSAHSHPPIEWLFALRGQKTEKSTWRDATDAVALASNPCPPFRRQRDPSRLGLVSASLAAWKLNQQKSIRQVRKRQWGNAKSNWISQPYSARIRKSQESNNSKYT